MIPLDLYLRLKEIIRPPKYFLVCNPICYYYIEAERLDLLCSVHPHPTGIGTYLILPGLMNLFKVRTPINIFPPKSNRGDLSRFIFMY